MLYEAESFDAAADQQGPGRDMSWQARSVVRTDGGRRPMPQVQLAAKRGLDILAALFLIVLLAPLLAAIALAIMVRDGVPVIYRQERYGRFGRVFSIYKFRTMIVAEPGRRFVQVSAGDPRVTRLGAFLRRTSLDELPQLFNVLFGQMSLVGPRPHAVAMEEDIIARYPRAARRLDVRPGMTGLAQVRGLRGPTATPEQLRARLDADIAYVESWSLWRDITILLRTPAAWILGKNAH